MVCGDMNGKPNKLDGRDLLYRLSWLLLRSTTLSLALRFPAADG